MQPTRCTRCPRKKCGILVATKIQVTAIDDMFLYAECLFMPICIENIWYQTPLQAHWTSGMMARCYISDAAVEIFSNLLHRCDFFAFLWFVFGDTRNRSSACLHFFQLADAKDSLTRWLWISKFSISEAFLKFFTFVRQTKNRFCLPRSMWTWPIIQSCGGQM